MSTTLQPDDNSNIRLSAREKKFLEFYLGEAKYSGVEAAHLAGFKAKSRAALGAQASKMLRKPSVAARLREHWEASTRSAEADLAELDRLAHSPDEDWQTPITSKEGGVVGHRFEPREKVKALELKLRARGQFSDNLVVRAIPSNPAELEAALREHIHRLADAEAEVVVSGPSGSSGALEGGEKSREP